MVRFTKTISKSEVKSTYLNLTDDKGKQYGPQMKLEHKDKLIVLDAEGRETRAQMHHENQLWGSLKQWFDENNVQPGHRLELKYYLSELKDGMHVIHLIPIQMTRTTTPIQDHEAVPLVDDNATDQSQDLTKKHILAVIKKYPWLIEPGAVALRPGDLRGFDNTIKSFDLVMKTPNQSLILVLIRDADEEASLMGEVMSSLGAVQESDHDYSSVEVLIVVDEPSNFLKQAVRTHPQIHLRRFVMTLEEV
jgi:hypothetical protein